MSRAIILILLAATGLSCMNHDKLSTVPELDLNRYAGTWYEIGRFPHSFEKNLQCVSATYSLREDGRIGVLNKGRKSDGRWSDINGKAWVADKQHPGRLKVQFFWPFRAPYWVLKLDKDYRYALVGTPSRDYLWILCRERSMPEADYAEYVKSAADLGFNTSKIQRVDQSCTDQ